MNQRQGKAIAWNGEGDKDNFLSLLPLERISWLSKCKQTLPYSPQWKWKCQAAASAFA